MIAGAVVLAFLQQYIWQLKIAEVGYGPYYPTGYLQGLSALMVAVDLLILWWARARPKSDRIASLAWPILWLTSSAVVIVANNLL